MGEKGSLGDFMRDLGKEIEKEAERRLTPEQQRLREISRKLLVLERDLRAPGAARTADDRVTRIIDELKKEAF